MQVSTKGDSGRVGPLLALHRYWIHAARLGLHFKAAAQQVRPAPEVPQGLMTGAILISDANILMTYWFGALQVVIEGYRELRCEDPEIEALLRSPNANLLRRFRNAAFHYQRDAAPDKLIALLDSDEALEWVQALERALGESILGHAQAATGAEARDRIVAAAEDIECALDPKGAA